MLTQDAPQLADLLPTGVALVVAGPLEIAALSARLAALGLPALSPLDVGVAVLRLEGASAPPRLTRREQEIAALVVRGLPNHQIAARLAVSQATVRTHLRHIYRKLGLANRAQVAVRLAASVPPTEPPDPP